MEIGKKQYLIENLTTAGQKKILKHVEMNEDENKMETLYNQISEFNKHYPGGLQKYVSNMKRLLTKKSQPIALDNLRTPLNKKEIGRFDPEYRNLQELSKSGHLSS